MALSLRCPEGECGPVTESGQTDLLYISLETGRIVKRLEMEDILGEEAVESRCSYVFIQVMMVSGQYSLTISVQEDRLHISDPGLGHVYSLHQEEGEVQALVCGVPEQWQGPGGVAGDTRGGLLVADTGHHRLVRLGGQGQVMGVVEVEYGLLQPGAIAVDAKARRMAVHNQGRGEVAVYRLED